MQINDYLRFSFGNKEETLVKTINRNSMQVYLTDRCTAYHYLLSHRKGTKKAFTSVLGEGYFTDFRNVGYIKEGVDGKWEERWQLTDFGEQQTQTHLSLAGLIGIRPQNITE